MNTQFAPLLREIGDREFQAAVPDNHPLLADHVVRGRRVLPGVACFDFAMAAIAARFPEFAVRAFEDCVWFRPVVDAGGGARLRIVLTMESATRCRFEIADEGGPTASGWASTVPTIPAPWPAAAGIWRRVTEESVRRINRRTVYEAFSGMGIDYGRHFRRIHYADIHENRAVALLTDNDAEAMGFCNLLDCSFQSGMAISIGTETASLMPFSLGTIVFHAPIDFGASRSFYAVTEKTTPFRTSIGIHDEHGAPLASVLDLGVKPSRL